MSKSLSGRIKTVQPASPRSDPNHPCLILRKCQHPVTAQAVWIVRIVPIAHKLPIDWVIVGGESGPGARPMHPDWVRSIRDQCQAANVPFFFKQWGEWLPWEPWESMPPLWQSQAGDCIDGHEAPWQNDECEMRPDWDEDFEESTGNLALFHRIGKKQAGRMLDGRVWDEYPKKMLNVEL